MLDKGVVDEELLPGPFLYRVDLSYVGTHFNGWQTQLDGSGVQDHLERAVSTILRFPVKLTAASRTDSGVYAENQVAIFRSHRVIEELWFLHALQGVLHPDIGVASLREVPADFHPIRSAAAKLYCYRLWLGRSCSPFCTPYVWKVPARIDLDLVERALPDFVGSHDFTSMCAAGSSAVTRERNVLELRMVRRGRLVEIYVLGEGFLKQMVRNIVGTATDIGLGKLPQGSVGAILAAKDRRAAGVTAAASGLSLLKVSYDSSQSMEDLLKNRGTGLCFGLESWP